MSTLHLLVRAWTALYTFALPPDIRDRRRAEIASDLWESEHDPDVPRGELLFRALRGLPADLLWRFEVTPGPQHAGAAASVLALAAMLAVAWWGFVGWPAPPHTGRVVPKPRQINLRLMPPPPPPQERP
jgi:hypothetical protein